MFWQYSDIGSVASDLGICTYTGKWEYIRSNMRWLPKTYAIFVYLTLSLSLYIYIYTHTHRDTHAHTLTLPYTLLSFGKLSLSHFNDTIITTATAY